MRYGHFDEARREYVIERPDVPVSWTNYLGVKDFCTVISHNAGGYSFQRSAEHHRITRFRPNGIPLDRPGHYVYLRDDETGEYWSVSWQPVGLDLSQARFEVCHGLSYTRFSCDHGEVRAEQTLFVPLDDDLELWDVRVVNTGSRTRRLSIFGYVEFSFHHIEIDNQNLQMSLYCAGSSCADEIIEYDLFYEPGMRHYFAANVPIEGFDAVRDQFLGPYRSETNPQAVENGACSGSVELGGNHCGALHKRLVLEPGEEQRLAFLLGVGDRAQGRVMREKYGEPAAVDGALADLARHWDDKLAAFQCRTPSPGLDAMTNIWTLYQAETCVVWSRFASFIEVGGRTGLGYRDTAQDVMSIPHTSPETARRRILELLHGQVSSGYGLHLFDPAVFERPDETLPAVKLPTVVPQPSQASIVHGLKDACSDDALWLVVSICEYVKETGDVPFFDVSVPFADSGSGTVYEHMKRALDFSAAQVGPTGICLGLRADWNDCLNLGGGESAMVSFLHHWALQAFVEAARFLGRTADGEKYAGLAETVRSACERELWDGEWYIRGITAKGVKIGSRESEEGKIFLESNAWAVLSDVASVERGRSCMDAVGRHLSSEFGLHLVWPAFSTPNDDIGYVTRVYKGIKENGAIFSHPNPWAMIAECKLGRGDRAMQLYDALLPYHQNDRIETRQAEPYSYCQFVMGRDHTAFGRARHPWLTGSGGWCYTAATHWILGLRPGYDGLTVDPCVPSGWKAFEVSRRWRGAEFKIRVSNPDGVETGLVHLLLNGQVVTGALPVCPAGSVNEVEVLMGRAPGATRSTTEA
jgi:N,N'-diacetylchitobiose phosphorylase